MKVSACGQPRPITSGSASARELYNVNWGQTGVRLLAHLLFARFDLRHRDCVTVETARQLHRFARVLLEISVALVRNLVDLVADEQHGLRSAPAACFRTFGGRACFPAF